MTDVPERMPLHRDFFDRPVVEVAPDLLGRTLVRHTPDGTIELRLTEVEAYDGESDPGSHAYRGRTARNATMFGPPGHAYVYFIYGMWFSLNAVCGPEGRASGVLLRAGEILTGAPLAAARRPKARSANELAKGPARLATALDIDRTLDGVDLCAGGQAPSPCCTAARPPPTGYATARAPASAETGPITLGVTGSPTIRRSAHTVGTSPDAAPPAQLDSPRSTA
ncbi:DNA-3-methyladenine glycosylase [Streptomyces sirii]|uniref:DNA-3-methyladenine glycosylase n=1 Tax=Streptomyces sirii TaxID=3127701 RepID=UPI003D3624FC